LAIIEVPSPFIANWCLIMNYSKYGSYFGERGDGAL